MVMGWVEMVCFIDVNFKLMAVENGKGCDIYMGEMDSGIVLGYANVATVRPLSSIIFLGNRTLRFFFEEMRAAF